MSNSNKKNEVMIYSVLGATIICYFIPLYIPYCVLGGVLSKTIYEIADTVSKSNYANSKYVSKENVKYFNNK